jgi:hypothetical protein
MKPTVNCALHLEERNNCCKSITIFPSILLSLINVVKVSIKKNQYK